MRIRLFERNFFHDVIAVCCFVLLPLHGVKAAEPLDMGNNGENQPVVAATGGESNEGAVEQSSEIANPDAALTEAAMGKVEITKNPDGTTTITKPKDDGDLVIKIDPNKSPSITIDPPGDVPPTKYPVTTVVIKDPPEDGDPTIITGTGVKIVIRIVVYPDGKITVSNGPKGGVGKNTTY